MNSRKTLVICVIAMVTLAACVPSGQSPVTSMPPTVTVPATATTAPATATSSPATSTTAPATVTTAPATATSSPTAGPTGLPPVGYRDDRSSAVAVLESYVNALNRKEYARAYGYWELNSEVGPFENFQAGFATTEAVTLTTGSLSGEGAAGNLFYSVPATLHTSLSDGTQQTFVGCYILHIAQPAVQATPPFGPLGIRSATLKQIAAGADTTALMGAACPPTVPLTPQPTPPAGNISAAYYIDDRSDPVAVVRSLFNAVNRHEYLRAYSYWKDGSNVGSFQTFEAGYTSTATVELVAGAPTSDVGAGQINYLVPVTLRVATTSGEQQTFVGCYNLHLSNPGIQSEPPYIPMGIRAAHVEPVAAGADTTALMATACATPPQ